MAYDSMCWGEEVQNTSLLGVLGKGPSPIAFTGDINTLRKGLGTPYLVGLGGVSDTKPNAVGISGNRSYGTQLFLAPAGMDFSGTFMRDLARPYQEGEDISGFGCNTNVSEGIVVQADIAYGAVHRYPKTVGEAAAMAGGGIMHSVPFSITSTAAVTPKSGLVALDAATSQDLWVNTDSTYHILGVAPNVSAATFGGTMTVTLNTKEWNGFIPGICVNPLSAVTFGTGGVSLAYEPIGPFPGDALPTVGLNSTSAGAIANGIILLEHK